MGGCSMSLSAHKIEKKKSVLCVFLSFVLTASILKFKTNIFLDASTEPRDCL